MVVLHRAVAGQGRNRIADTIKPENTGAIDHHGGISAQVGGDSALQDGAVADGRRAAVSIGTRCRRQGNNPATCAIIDGERGVGCARDRTADGEGGTVGAGPVHAPRLRRTEDDGGADGDGPGIGADRDASRRERRRDGKAAGGAADARGDGHDADAGRGAREIQGIDRIGAIKRGGDGGATGKRSVAVAEGYRVRGAWVEAGGGGAAGRQIPIRVGSAESGPTGIHAAAPVEGVSRCGGSGDQLNLGGCRVEGIRVTTWR